MSSRIKILRRSREAVICRPAGASNSSSTPATPTAGNGFAANGEARLTLSKMRRRGATIVEFSLVFLLFVVVLVALCEFGRCMWTYATIAHAARQAGRYCMVHGSENPATIYGVEQAVKKHCIGLDPSQVQVTATWGAGVAPADVKRGEFVEVQVTYPFQFVAAGLLLEGGSTIQLGSTTRMMVLN